MNKTAFYVGYVDGMDKLAEPDRFRDSFGSSVLSSLVPFGSTVHGAIKAPKGLGFEGAVSGAVGGTAGMLAGGLVGGGLGGAIAGDRGKHIGGTLGALLGGAAGHYGMTKKYRRMYEEQMKQQSTDGLA